MRWSWGYHVLLAPRERYLEEEEREDLARSRIEQGRTHYADNPGQTDPDEPLVRTRSSEDLQHSPGSARGDGVFRSGDQTPVSSCVYSYSKVSSIHSDDETAGDNQDPDQPPSVIGPPPSGPLDRKSVV